MIEITLLTFYEEITDVDEEKHENEREHYQVHKSFRYSDYNSSNTERGRGREQRKDRANLVTGDVILAGEA